MGEADACDENRVTSFPPKKREKQRISLDSVTLRYSASVNARPFARRGKSRNTACFRRARRKEKGETINATLERRSYPKRPRDTTISLACVISILR